MAERRGGAHPDAARFLWKLLYIVGICLCGAFALTMCGLAALRFIMHTIEIPPLWKLYRLLSSIMGLEGMALLATGVLFIAGLLWLLGAEAVYYGQIKDSLVRLADGEEARPLPVKRSAAELGEAADAVNRLSQQMSAARENEQAAAERMNALMTELSHDVRTPLTSILGYLQLIAEDGYRDEVELRHYIQVARDKALRLSRAVDRRFELARLPQVPERETWHPVDVRRLLLQLAEEYRSRPQQPGLAIALNCAELGGQPMMIYGDGTRLMEAFEILMAEAARGGRPSGPIRIGLFGAEEEAVVHIRNDGVPEAEAPRREKGMRRPADRPPAQDERFGGGWADVRGIVASHGGTVAVFGYYPRAAYEVRLPLLRTGDAAEA
ncbi:HAMP domain-containing histidine kinase [Paenibacillus melissococcoides]|uniref:histidine kinase n=1 Tax=Paenibacillus melissococcoides TaxID=2912268 RepID=A0ABN8U005_9BACL|nr:MULTISPECIES: HAMP domain-containing sensor histidine kinase [Paenibacillus]GIO80126.1 two-component sensor histidine kinase [Paenibacillus dendritiformis]CAH8243917.1 HAMP domain-containing histidine kinase [Paenibacillus melissococcoides]CAH8704214.1 HAMP domain-containing histidine kinase [Paenibacillus melissococcoides]CAH8706983.1 HAMP domain-containing histidine kinase [Paenibacillus melissococcoides]